jgi:hypothetical protein
MNLWANMLLLITLPIAAQTDDPRLTEIRTECLAPDLLDGELSVFMQRLRAQGAAGAPGLA